MLGIVRALGQALHPHGTCSPSCSDSRSRALSRERPDMAPANSCTKVQTNENNALILSAVPRHRWCFKQKAELKKEGFLAKDLIGLEGAALAGC